MPLNLYFHNFDSTPEQLLLEDLIVESIKIYGVETVYCPRRVDSKDEVLGEDDTSYYDRGYPLEMYVSSVDGFMGDKTFFSKFGLEIQDQLRMQVARRSFQKEVAHHEAELQRPGEGDLVYFPFNKKVFQIRYVDTVPVFYQMGTMQTYELTLELFAYSNERLATGYEEIDALQKMHSLDILDYVLQTENGFSLRTEDGDYLVSEKYVPGNIDTADDSTDIQIDADDIIDWSELDPLGDGRY